MKNKSVAIILMFVAVLIFVPTSSAFAQTVPSQITDLEVTVGGGRVTLTWTAPNLNGGTFNYYDILYNDNTISTLRDHSDTSITFIGLAMGKNHTFTIVTYSSTGFSLQSNVVTVTPGLPSQITDLTATAGDGEVTLTWTAPNLNGGTFIHYDIFDYGSSASTKIRDHSITSKTFTGLTNGKNHTFTIVTRSSAGISLTSNIVTVTPATLPSQTTDFSVIAGVGEVTLTWSVSDLNGGTFIHYDILNHGSSTNTRILDHSITSKTFTGLTSDEEYTFTIVTRNSIGFSIPSNVVTVTPLGLPSQITDLSHTTGDETVTLTWTAPNLNGGTFIHYDIFYYGSSTNTRILDHSDTSITFTGLANGGQHLFTIVTRSSIGLSIPSNVVIAIPVELPSQTTDFSAIAGDGEVTLTWSVSDLNGGAFNYYDIFNYGSSTSTKIRDHSITSKTFTGLTNDEEYTFTIVTRSSIGFSMVSNVVTVTPRLASPPTTPDFTFTFESIGVDSSLDLSNRGIVDDTDAFADLTILICDISSPVNTTSGLSASSVNKLEETNCREVTDKNALVFNLSSTNGIPQTVAYIVTNSNDLSSKGNITFVIIDKPNNPPTAPDISFRLEAGVDHVIDFIAEGISDDNTEVSDLIVTLTDFESVFDIYVEILSGTNVLSNVVTDVNKQVTIGSTSSALSGFRSQDVMYTVTDSQGQSSTGTISFDIIRAKPIVPQCTSQVGSIVAFGNQVVGQTAVFPNMTSLSH